MEGGAWARASDTDHISSCIEPLLVAYSATRIPESWLGARVTCLPSGHHTILHEVWPKARQFCWDGDTKGTVLQMNVGTTSLHQTAKNELPSFVPSRLLLHRLERIRLTRKLYKDLSNSILISTKWPPLPEVLCSVTPAFRR